MKHKSVVFEGARKNRLKMLLGVDDNFEDFEVENEKFLSQNINIHLNLFSNCLQSLSIKKDKRNFYENKLICLYLENLQNFMDIISSGSQNGNDSQKTLYKISSYLDHVFIPKNNILFKHGEKADKFYIILKGKVQFLIPKIQKCYLSLEEYLEYLLELRINGEIELVKNLINLNKVTYDIGGEDFDRFIINSLEKHENNNENLYSIKIYKQFEKLRRILIENKNNNTKLKKVAMEPEKYILLTTKEEQIKKSEIFKREPINIYKYIKTNIFENGEIFGFVGLENKINKRTATVIALEDCDFGILGKQEFVYFFERIIRTARNKILELISSYNMLYSLPKITFDYQCFHMFKYEKYYRNDILMRDIEPLHKVFLVKDGKFEIYINKNLIEINNLIIKLKLLRGKLLGLSQENINKDLREKYQNQVLILNKNYISKGYNDLINNKQRYTISFVFDKLVLGFEDTVDPKTRLPLFNCKCISEICEGYEIKTDLLGMLNKDFHCKTETSNATLTRIEYFLKRVVEFKQNLFEKLENNSNKFINNFPNDLKFNAIKTNKNLSYDENNDKINDNIHVVNNTDINDSNITRNGLYKNRNNFFRSPIFYSSKINLTKKVKHENILTEEDKEKIKETLLNKIRKNIKQKRLLLKLSQKKSRNYILNEKNEKKILAMKQKLIANKARYKDIAFFFEPMNEKPMFRKENYKIKDLTIDRLIKKANSEAKIGRELSSCLIKNENNNDEIKSITMKDNKTTRNNDHLLQKDDNKFFTVDNESKLKSPEDEKIKNMKIKCRNLSIDFRLNENEKNKYYDFYSKYITNELNKKYNKEYLDKVKEVPNIKNTQKLLLENNNKNCPINLKKECICTPENLRVKDRKFKVSYVDPLVLDKFNFNIYRMKINGK